MRNLKLALCVFLASASYAHADSERPSTVSNVQASSVSSNVIRVTWNEPFDNVGVDGYNIYRNDSYYSTVFNTTNFLDTGISSGSSYSYSVVAFDRARNYSTLSASASSSGSSSSQPAPAPVNDGGAVSAPTGLRAESVSSSQLKLSWNAPSGSITGYNLYRDGSYYTTVKGRTDHTASSLSSGRNYRWSVVAFSGNTYSVQSSEITAGTSGNSGSSEPQAAAQSSSSSSSSAVPSGYQLAFSEDFNSNRVDSSKWNTRYRWGPYWTINNEEQFYVDSLNDSGFGHSPFSFDGNNMTLSAIRTPSNLRDKSNGKSYLSGAMTTYGKFRMRYGYVEMRARMPAGRGLWPAFWLLHDHENGNRPEIDIVEMIGSRPTIAYQTYHYYDNWNLRSTPTYEARGPDYSQDFHTYGMKWEPGKITWYVDGRATNSYSSGNVSNEDMYILVNLAIGGAWAGSPDGSTPFPANFTIDYIRAYRRP